jgi:hypothetical protein
MTNIVRTARGSMVDFDLLKIKQQLSDAPAPTEVAARENFVEKRLKRKLRTKTVPTVVVPPVDEDEPKEEVEDESNDTAQ